MENSSQKALKTPVSRRGLFLRFIVLIIRKSAPKDLFKGALILILTAASGSFCAAPLQDQKGYQALESGRTEESVAYFKEHLQRYPSDGKARNNLAVAYMRLGQHDNALSELQKVTAQTPDDAAAHYNLALVYNFKGLIDQEIEEYRKTVSLSPSHYGAHLNLGHALAEKGRKPEAVEQYLWVLGKTPDNPKVLFNIGLLYRDLKEKDQAILMLKKYLETDPGGKYAPRAKKVLSELTGTGKPAPALPKK